MEMKRLHSPRSNMIARWLHVHFGLTAWYKYASDYGENYVKPSLWLIPILLLFAFLYPLAGLHMEPTRAGLRPRGHSSSCTAAIPATTPPCPEKLTYSCPWHEGNQSVSIWRARERLLGNSFMTSLYVAAFQKDLTYQPSYPWGRLLAFAEVLLTSTLGALFLLAVRRQFRR